MSRSRDNVEVTHTVLETDERGQRRSRQITDIIRWNERLNEGVLYDDDGNAVAGISVTREEED